MGDPVPIIWPGFEAFAWYKCTVDAYGSGDPPEYCTDPFSGQTSCCLRGNSVQAWYDEGGDCLPSKELCLFSAFSAQRLVGIVGPFDDLQDCRDAI